MTTPTPSTLAETVSGFAFVGDTLHIDNERAIGRIRRKNLSASVANAIRKCPASMAASSVLPRVLDPFSPAELGTGGHEVLEHFYRLAPAERTIDKIPQLVHTATATFWGRPEMAAWPDRETEIVRWAAEVQLRAEAIFNVEDPTTLNVYATELDVRDVVIAGEVPARAFLDRVILLGEYPDGSPRLSLDDYKFGKFKPHNPRFTDDYGDQQRMYAELLRLTTGHAPETARLIYPLAGQERPIDLSAGAMRLTLDHLTDSWRNLNTFSDTGDFPTKPGALCGWCDLAQVCPAANITTEKAKASAATRYTPTELGIPTLRAGAAPATPATTDPESMPVAEANESGRQVVDTPRIGEIGGAASGITPQEEPMTESTLLRYPTSDYAALNAFGLVDLATKHLEDQSQPLTANGISALATVLAGIVTRTEAALFGNIGWESGKHSRLRFALAVGVEVRPAPFGGDQAAWTKWITTQEKLLETRARIALGLIEHDRDFPADAYLAFVPAPAVKAA